MSTTSEVKAAIDANNARVDSASSSASAYIHNAESVARGYAGLGAITKPDFTDFQNPAYTPDANLALEFLNQYNDLWAGIEARTKQLMADWMGTYFPKLDPLLSAGEDAWLRNVVENGYIGIPAGVENAIWERDRSRELLDANRVMDEAVNGFALRGFGLPPGALSAAVLDVQMAANDKISTQSRDVAINQAKISVEMTKFAIEEMTKLRLGVASALGQFVHAAIAIPTAAANIAEHYANMRAKLWDSSAAYLNALTGKAHLGLTKTTSQGELDIKANSLSMSEFQHEQDLRIQVALKGAEQLGNIAAHAISAQQSFSNIGNITTG